MNTTCARRRCLNCNGFTKPFDSTVVVTSKDGKKKDKTQKQRSAQDGHAESQCTHSQSPNMMKPRQRQSKQKVRKKTARNVIRHPLCDVYGRVRTGWVWTRPLSHLTHRVDHRLSCESCEWEVVRRFGANCWTARRIGCGASPLIHHRSPTPHALLHPLRHHHSPPPPLSSPTNPPPSSPPTPTHRHLRHPLLHLPLLHHKLCLSTPPPSASPPPSAPLTHSLSFSFFLAQVMPAEISDALVLSEVGHGASEDALRSLTEEVGRTSAEVTRGPPPPLPQTSTTKVAHVSSNPHIQFPSQTTPSLTHFHL